MRLDGGNKSLGSYVVLVTQVLSLPGFVSKVGS